LLGYLAADSYLALEVAMTAVLPSNPISYSVAFYRAMSERNCPAHRGALSTIAQFA
jgi:hypothetical protein